MSRPSSSDRRRWPRVLDRRGATAIEMAAVSAALFLLLLGGTEIGRYFFLLEQVKYVVGEAARATVIDPYSGWGAQQAAGIATKSRVLDAAKLQLTIQVSPLLAAPALSKVTVAAQYPFRFTLPYLSSLAPTINSGLTLEFVATPKP